MKHVIKFYDKMSDYYFEAEDVDFDKGIVTECRTKLEDGTKIIRKHILSNLEIITNTGE